MNRDSRELTKWIEQQKGGDLHLHNHHYYGDQPPQSLPVVAPGLVEPARPDRYAESRVAVERIHPATAAVMAIAVSIALALPLTLIAVIVDAMNQPAIHYQNR